MKALVLNLFYFSQKSGKKAADYRIFKNLPQNLRILLELRVKVLGQLTSTIDAVTILIQMVEPSAIRIGILEELCCHLL